MGKCCHLQMELLRREKPSAFQTPNVKFWNSGRAQLLQSLSRPFYPAHALHRDEGAALNCQFSGLGSREQSWRHFDTISSFWLLSSLGQREKAAWEGLGNLQLQL